MLYLYYIPMFIYLPIFAAISIKIRLSNSDLTETQLYLKFRRTWLLLLAIFLVLFLVPTGILLIPLVIELMGEI